MYDLRDPWNLKKKQWSLTLEIYGRLVGEFNISSYNILYGGISAMKVDSKENWDPYPLNTTISVDRFKCHKICDRF